MQANTQSERRTHARADEAPRASLDKVLQAKDQLASDFGALVSDAEDLLKSTAKYSGEGLNSARVRFRDNLDHFKGRLAGAQDVALNKWNRAAEATNGYVHDNPWKIVSAAAAVGVILGFLLRKK